MDNNLLFSSQQHSLALPPGKTVQDLFDDLASTWPHGPIELRQLGDSPTPIEQGKTLVLYGKARCECVCTSIYSIIAPSREMVVDALKYYAKFSYPWGSGIFLFSYRHIDANGSNHWVCYTGEREYRIIDGKLETRQWTKA